MNLTQGKKELCFFSFKIWCFGLPPRGYYCCYAQSIKEALWKGYAVFPRKNHKLIPNGKSK